MRRSDDVPRPRAGRPDPDQPAAVPSARPASAPLSLAERVLVTGSGTRQPIVAILLAIVFFTVISGKPLDGLLLFVAAAALAWDAGSRSRDLAGTGQGEPGGLEAGSAADPGPAEPRAAWRPRASRPPLRRIGLGVALAVAYSLTVGSFIRMSWPATAGVAGVGAGVVIIGWGGPLRQREVPGRFSRTGVLAWGTVLVTGGLWELAALLGQPTLEQSSYAHPTISTLTDPLLASTPGRTIALLGWIALGAYLVDR